MGCGASQVAADSGSGYAPAAEAPTTRRSVQNDLPEPQIRAVAGHDYDGAEKGSETETNARREIKRQLTQGLSPDAQLKTHVHQEKVSDNAFFSQSELNERRSDRMSATVAQRKGSLDESLLRQSRASREVDPALMGHVRSSRFHSVSSAFGYVRYCEWVNAEDVFLYELLVGFTPFCFENKDLNPTIIYQNILNPKYEIEYPSRLSSEVVHLVSSLLRSKPMERVGCLSGGPADIRKHVFFQKDDFDWGKLLRLELPPPYVPKIKSETDVSNFDRIESKVDFFAGEPYDFSDARQWDVDF